jgi:hypothetical protein
MTQTAGSTVEALAVRNCITKGAFAELRGACVRQGGPLTGEFLDLEGEIDNFALQFENRITNASVIIRMGKHAGLGEQLALIEKKATALREGAFDRLSGSAGTAPPRRSGAAVPGSFATVEAEALIGAPAPPISEPEPRRSLLRYWFGWRAAG